MASQIDFSRLRRPQVLGILDITQGGIMGEINLDDARIGGESSDYDMRGINLPKMETPFGGEYRPQDDPRQPVNPNIAPIAGPGSSGDEAMQRTIDAINRIYRPEYTSRDRYNRLLDAAPEREGPGVMRGLAAFGMGLSAKDPESALNVHERVLYAPHHRNMADFAAKTGPFGNAAQYENTANINERTLAGNVVTAQTQADRLAESARQADQKNEVARMIAIARQATAAKWTIKEVGDRMIAYPPTPEQGEPMDLGPSGMLTEREKIDLQNAGRLAVVNQQGANQMAVQGSRNAGALAVQTLRNQRITGNGSTRGLLPSQQKDALYNKAQEWILRHPEDKEFITLNPDGSFEVQEYSKSFLGYDKGMPLDRYDQFIDYLYGSGGMPQAAPSGMPTPPPAPPIPEGGQGQGQFYGGDPRYPVPQGLKLPPGGPNQMKMPQGPLQGQPQTQPQQTRPQMPAQGQARPQLRIATDPRPGAAPEPTPEQVQAVNQIQQQIQRLETQLAYIPPTTGQEGFGGGPTGPRIGPAASEDPFAQPLITPETNLGPGITGAMDYIRGGLRPQQGTTPPSPQAQIQAEIARLKQQQQQILSAPPPATPQQGQITPELQQRAVQHLQRLGLPVTPANIAHAVKVGDVR